MNPRMLSNNIMMHSLGILAILRVFYSVRRVTTYSCGEHVAFDSESAISHVDGSELLLGAAPNIISNTC